MTIIERLRQYKELDPHKIALIVDDKKYTYGDLYDAILSIDINDTSRIVNVAQTKESSKHIVALIQSQSFVEQLVQWLGGLYTGYIPMVCHNEMDTDYVEELARIIAYKGVAPLADFGVLTSGTTGRPKPLWRSEALGESSLIFKTIFFISTKIQKSSYMEALVLLVLVIWLSLCYGLEEPVITTSSLRPNRWIQLIEEYHVDHIYALPTKLRLLVRHCKSKVDSINYIIGGSQVLDRQLMEQLERICPNMEFILYYGASELNYITYCTGKEWLDREGTVGRPFPSVKLQSRTALFM